MRLHNFAGALILALFSFSVSAHEYTLGALTIVHPHAMATVAGQSMGGSFMTIKNAGADDQLVSVSTPIAAWSQLHSMITEGMVMKMRPIKTIDLPAGATVELQQKSGAHIMLEGLSKPLEAGASFPMKLQFAHTGSITVQVHVEPLDGSGHTM